MELFNRMDVNSREKRQETWGQLAFSNKEAKWGVHRMDASAASQDLLPDIAAGHGGCNRVGINSTQLDILNQLSAACYF
jgi:hypothetical protein